jgi:shikimate dehydrogenase
MKLGLLGFPIGHSLSPVLYEKLLGPILESYKLFSFEDKTLIPDIKFFASELDGLNITSPYKTHFINDVEIPSSLVKELGAINTIAFKDGAAWGTNTDLLAIVEILKNYLHKYQQLKIILLGDGVMAKVTKIVTQDLNIPVQQFSRKMNSDFLSLDLTALHDDQYQTIVINSCSRDFVFQGTTTGKEIFWDYNYSHRPHLDSIPSKVLLYQDGQEMLELQAREAIKFWESYL